MTTTGEPRQTPEAELITEAMLRRRWKAPQLAREARMSVDWIRALARGWRSVGKGTYAAAVPDDATLAVLAQALGNINEQQLRDIGRAGAAKALALLRADAQARTGQRSDPIVDKLMQIRDDLDALISDARNQRT